MARNTGSSLMFDEEEVKSTTRLLPRLIRVIFYGLSITNDGYIDRYSRFYRDRFPDKTKKEFGQKSAADRKFLHDRKRLTFNLMSHATEAMGYDIESVSVRLKDRLTGEYRTFSTDDTVDDLKAVIAKEKEIGVQSLGGFESPREEHKTWFLSNTAPEDIDVETKVDTGQDGDIPTERLVYRDGNWYYPEGDTPTDYTPTHWRW